MHSALQFALFLASVAIVVFVAVALPAVIQFRQQVSRLARAAEELQADLRVLVRDLRETLQGLKEISQRAHSQMDNVEHLLKVARGWVDRVDLIVEEVGTAVERPILRTAR